MTRASALCTSGLRVGVKSALSALEPLMRQWTVDAFATASFKGNPACVLEPQDAWPDDVWMQALASENNQAETAFLLKTPDHRRFGLRWFTPSKEVLLCGHATLAAAHVLFTELNSSAETIEFDTRHSGVLGVSRLNGGLEMNFPTDRPVRAATPAGLARALGATPTEVWIGQFLVAVLDDEAAVRSATPDIPALMAFGAGASAGLGNIAVTALADAGRPYDVVSRFFGPGVGIPEDPTTGSLHCTLAPLYADKLGRQPLRFHQAYPGRGGDLEAEVQGARTLLRGQARTVIESQLRL